MTIDQLPTADAEQLQPVDALLMRRHEATLATLGLPLSDIVLLIRDDVPAVANAFAQRFTNARIHVLGARRPLTAPESAQLHRRVTYRYAASERDRLNYLRKIPRPQAIVEAGNRKRVHKLSCFKEFLFFVQPSGAYIVDELDSTHHPKYDDEQGQNLVDLLTELARADAVHPMRSQDASRMIHELSGAIESITFSGRTAIIRRSGQSYFLKLRDWEADPVLTSHFGDRWGEVLERRPARPFMSRATVTSHGKGPIQSGSAKFDIPDRLIRRYHNAVCTARQVVRYEEFVLPDSWRHPHQRVLNNRQLAHSSPYAGRYLERTAPISERRLSGSYFYLDTELPGHFGHITTEVLSRLWAWDIVQRHDPATRVLISVASLPKEMPAFQKTIFAAMGIPEDAVEIIGPRESVTVETLYGATPQLENPFYIDPDMRDTWRELDSKLPDEEPPFDSDRLFISRRPSVKRHCIQTSELEEFFATHNFDVVYPEDLSYCAQKTMFKRARIIAGFGGSGMFNMMFAPAARIIIISGDSYTAENEHLFAAANGNDLHYFWGQSKVSMPKSGRFSLEAFTSGFEFDLDRFGPVLSELSD